MTQDEIICMAREAGLLAGADLTSDCNRLFTAGLERFATLVGAAERKACACECDKTYHQHIGDGFGEVRYGIAACAAAIRARKD